MSAVVDVSRLPRYAFGHRSILWWGTVAFIVSEATVFALALMSYLYLRQKAPQWPPNLPPPPLFWGAVNTGIMLASAVPNWLVKRAAEAERRRPTQLWLVVCLLFGVAFLVGRWFELAAMNVAWDTNAYGSVVWALLGFHTFHLLTDFGDSVVLTVLMFTKHGQGKRFVDCSDNAFYWWFVVGAWLPIWAVIYILPRVA